MLQSGSGQQRGWYRIEGLCHYRSNARLYVDVSNGWNRDLKSYEGRRRWRGRARMFYDGDWMEFHASEFGGHVEVAN